LPVPLSPVMSTVASLSATCSIRSRRRRTAGLSPTIAPPWRDATASRSRRTSLLSWRWPTARPSAMTSASIAIGLVMKS
jgi:hypothetical protein